MNNKILFIKIYLDCVSNEREFALKVHNIIKDSSRIESTSTSKIKDCDFGCTFSDSMVYFAHNPYIIMPFMGISILSNCLMNIMKDSSKELYHMNNDIKVSYKNNLEYN